jgi:hypothetical protein
MISYPDTITLLTTDVNLYGSEIVDEESEVACAIELNTGYMHTANQDAVNSDAIVFIDPNDPFVVDNFYRLEEMLVVITKYGSKEEDAWYKVTKAIVSMDHQLTNQIDNVQLNLKKTTSIVGIT